MSDETTGEIVAEPTLAPEAEAPAPEIVADLAPDAPDAPTPEPDAPAELTAEQKAIKKLEGRLGYKTKVEKELQAELAEQRRQNEAYQALLAAQRGDGPTDTETPAQAPSRANGERTFTQAELTAEARRIASVDAFNRQADEVYEAGKKAFPDFDDAVTTLREVGAMSQPLIEAAMATGEAATVLHFLGNDPDEAARITTLPPIKMGVELAKLAGKLAAAAPARVSSAPAPIKPLGGTAKAELDVYDPRLSAGDHVSAEYIALRAKQGFSFAKPQKDRTV